MELDTPKTIQEREEMVQKQIISRNIKDKRVSQALLKIHRHVFIPEPYRRYAYHDTPLMIGEGQTISQPYIVALMSELLSIRPTDKILEIGTGSGYQTAICAELAGEVYTIERIAELARRAEEILKSLEYQNIHFFVGDGSRGIPDFAPYDKIIVTAYVNEIYPIWVEELKEDGIIVLPLGNEFRQTLIRGRKQKGSLKIEKHGSVVFVPLIEEPFPNK